MILNIVFLLIPIISIIAFLLDGDVLFYITGIMVLIGLIGLLISGKINPKSLIFLAITCWICTKWASVFDAIILGSNAFIIANNILFVVFVFIGTRKPIKHIKKSQQQHKPQCPMTKLSQDENLRMTFRNYFIHKLNSHPISNRNGTEFDKELLLFVNKACEEIKNDEKYKLLFWNFSELDEIAYNPTIQLDANKILEEEKWRFLQDNYKTYFNQRQANTHYIALRING